MRFCGVFHDSITQLDSFTFEVNGVDSIHFTLLEGAFEHFFLIVKDPEQTVRALLTYKTRLKQYSLTTSALTSDNNTLPGPLQNGTWSAQIIRTYPVKGSYEFEVAFNLGASCRKSENPMLTDRQKHQDTRTGWFRGDFHLHSAYSDGRISLDDILEACKSKQLDFISMTDHSTVTTSFPNSSLLVIPGTEITWDDDGHYNVHGLTKLPDYADFLKKSKSKNEALDSLFRYFRKDNCVLSINHPFPYGWKLRHNYDIRSFQTLEVINAPHLFNEEIDNEKALRFFDFLWQNGHYLYAVGGSDAHKKNYFDKYPVGIPTTKVYCRGLCMEQVLNSLQKGHTYLQTEEDFEISYHRPSHEKDIILPGDRVQGAARMKARSTHRVYWQLIRSGSILDEKYGTYYSYTAEIKQDEYYRLQARNEEGKLILLVNPIHDMHRLPDVFMLQELLTAFEQEDALKKQEVMS